MGLVLTTAPALEPLELAPTKRFLRIEVDDTDEDDDVTSLIAAARERCERVTGRALIEQEWRLTLDDWPWDGLIRLPKPPLLAVESVQYTDPATGTLTTIDEDDYQVDESAEPGLLLPASGASWPATRCGPASVRVTFTAGYGDAIADVPAEIRERLKNYVAYCFQNRVDRDERYLDRLFEGFTCGDYA